MKISIVLCVVLTICQSAYIPNRRLTEEEKKIKQLADLFEIDLLSRPEDGLIQGVRLRRSDGGESIDIEDEHDGSISVNGIRIKRNDLSDVEFRDSETADSNNEEDSEGAGSDRTRRSGDLFGFFGQVFSKKLSSLAGASSGHHAESDLAYGPPIDSYHTKSFDIWAFKKAILSTLLQAVKAIKGGVIALGGQIIKAKGHLISTKGKIVAHKGEALSEFGRNIAAKALLHHSGPATAFGAAAIDHHVPEPIHAGYPAAVVSTGYGAPSPTYTGGLSAYGGAGVSHGYAKRGATSQQFGVPQERQASSQSSATVQQPSQNNPYQKRASAYSATSARDSATAPSEQEDVVEVQPTAEERSYYYY